MTSSNKFFPWAVLLTAVAISSVAAWFSVVGLAAIFSGQRIAAMIMGGSLEVGKLIAASWVRRYWKLKEAAFIKSYLIVATAVLIFITSIGIFGFLSRGHLEQNEGVAINTSQIGFYQSQIENEKTRIEQNNRERKNIEESLSGLIQHDRLSKSLTERKAFKKTLNDLDKQTDESNSKIVAVQEKLLPLQMVAEKKAVEVGPLKYIAEMLYEEQSDSNLEKSVRYMIILLIFVFDPLAILLLLAAQVSFEQEYGKKEPPTRPKSIDSDYPPVDEVLEAVNLATPDKPTSPGVTVREIDTKKFVTTPIDNQIVQPEVGPLEFVGPAPVEKSAGVLEDKSHRTYKVPEAANPEPTDGVGKMFVNLASKHKK